MANTKVVNSSMTKEMASSPYNLVEIVNGNAYSITGTLSDGIVLNKESLKTSDISSFSLPAGVYPLSMAYVAAINRVSIIGTNFNGGVSDGTYALYLVNPLNMNLANTINLTPAYTYLSNGGISLDVYGSTLVASWVVDKSGTTDPDILNGNIVIPRVIVSISTTNLAVTTSVVEGQTISEIIGAISLSNGGFKILTHNFVVSSNDVTQTYSVITLGTSTHQYMPDNSIISSATYISSITMFPSVLPVGFRGSLFYAYESNTQKVVEINLATSVIKWQVVTGTELLPPEFVQGVISSEAIFLATTKAVFKLPTPFVATTSTPYTVIYQVALDKRIWGIIPIGNKLNLMIKNNNSGGAS